MGREQRPAAWVTGARGGLGTAVVNMLLADGYDVAALDTTPVPSATRASNRRLDLVGSVADETDVRRAAERIETVFGRLDALVNLAGINYHSSVTHIDLSEWHHVLAVNVTGMVSAIKHAAPLLLASPRGAVVNMSSISAQLGSRGYSAYVASKAAVEGLTRSLALELVPVRVCAIAPGWVDTPFSDAGLALSDDPAASREAAESSHALGRMARPAEIAEAIRWLVSPAASFVTGSVLTVDGGYLVNN